LKEISDEFQGYVWDTVSKGANKGASKEKPLKRRDHLINSIQYLVSMKPKGRITSAILAQNPNNSYT
jgi:hypothetical protein